MKFSELETHARQCKWDSNCPTCFEYLVRSCDEPPVYSVLEWYFLTVVVVVVAACVIYLWP